MKWFGNLKLRAKFWLMGGLILFFFILVGGLGLWGIGVVNGLLQQTQAQEVPKLYELAFVRARIQNVRINYRQALNDTTDDKLQSDLDRIKTTVQEAHEHWQTYLTFGFDNQTEKDLDAQVNIELTNWENQNNQLINLIISKDKNVAQTLNNNFGQKISDLFSQLVTNAYDNINKLSVLANQTYQQIFVLYIILMLIVVVVTAVVITLLVRSINGPVGKLQTATQALASGDLTQQIEIKTKDELGELGETYNATLTALRVLVSQLYLQSSQVSAATEELNAQSSSQVAGSSQQAAAITEIAHSLHELNATAHEIAKQTFKTSSAVGLSLKQAQTVTELSDKMASAQNQGRITVAHTVEILQTLQSQIATIEEQQQVLVGKTASASRIVQLIDEVAKETHLLALNAAIEAAGAGEYGDRFAIIAGEIKNLANRSVNATKEVRTTLGSIVQSVQQASEQAKEGLFEVEQAVTQAIESDETLIVLTKFSEQVRNAAHLIVEQVQNTADLASTIEVATRQQQSASQQMLERMNEIEAVTAQNLYSIKQSEAATVELRQAAQELEESADAFKLQVA